MKKIFITRDLDNDSLFRKILTLNGFEVHGQSLVAFAPIRFQAFPRTDWVFFYSKNAVRFFLADVAISSLESCKIAALGDGTAAVLREKGLEPDFIGNGEPPKVAEAFLDFAAGCSVLFPRANDSRQSIQKLLVDRIQSLDLVVYENVEKKELELLNDYEALVFTSPMNAKAYFSKYARKNEAVIAIGVTTAAALRKLSVADITVAAAPSEPALAASVIKLVENQA